MLIAEQVPWRVHGQDPGARSHLFTTITDDEVKAPCSTRGRVDELRAPTQDDTPCLICLTVHGRELAAQMGRMDGWGAVWEPFPI